MKYILILLSYIIKVNNNTNSIQRIVKKYIKRYNSIDQFKRINLKKYTKNKNNKA